jgi:hypothetical protein
MPLIYKEMRIIAKKKLIRKPYFSVSDLVIQEQEKYSVNCFSCIIQYECVSLCSVVPQNVRFYYKEWVDPLFYF